MRIGYLNVKCHHKDFRKIKFCSGGRDISIWQAARQSHCKRLVCGHPVSLPGAPASALVRELPSHVMVSFISEAHAAEHVLEAVHKGNREVSSSHQHQSPSKKNVEISITMPGTKRKKKGWYV